MKRLRRLAVRSVRAQRREFLAEGPQAVREALADSMCLEVLATAGGTERSPDLLAAATATQLTWTVVDDDVLAALSGTVSPQGVVALCRFVDVPLDMVLAPSPRLLAVCADVRDPGNAGTVIRCADAAGADAVVLTGASVDPYNPKVVRASVGSAILRIAGLGFGTADGSRRPNPTFSAARPPLPLLEDRRDG